MFRRIGQLTRRVLGVDQGVFSTRDHALDFSCEHMEQRLLLAGNVVVRDLAGTLNITGDDLSNGITVVETLDDRYIITPQAGTTINGSTSAYTTRVYELEPSLVILMRGGDDTVNLGPLSDMRSIRADLGAGNDDLTANAIETRGSMTFQAGDGDDDLILTGAESHGLFSVNLGAGIDSLQGSNVDGTVGSIIGGTGRDVVQLSDADFGVLRFNSGDGDDELTFSGLQSETERSANINLGDGNDQLTFENFEASTLVVNAGPGDDTVIAATGINQIAVRAVFLGGPGASDSLNVSAMSFGANPAINGFETVVGV